MTMNGLSPTFLPPANGGGELLQMATAPPKNITFQLLMADTQGRARLHMRVQIYPHDTTESIVTTVKNFYGIYPTASMSVGVSFEDDRSNTLIARYENFRDNMIVYVRAVEEPLVEVRPASRSSTQPSPTTHIHTHAEAVPVVMPGFSASWPTSQSLHDTRKSASASAGNKIKARQHRSGDTSYDGYSSGDGASSSTTSSRPKDPIPNTEISVENIVEGGRRKRAKFESSELPLFAPLQMPATNSNPSGSPVRRASHQHRPSLPVLPGYNPLVHAQPLVSPQSYGASGAVYSTPVSDSRRPRVSISYPNPNGILPTPDPTVGSCVSDEDKDVAMQLMRLGETSTHSAHVQLPATSTFHGVHGPTRVDASSSTGITSRGDGQSDEDDNDAPPARRQKLIEGSGRPMLPATEDRFALYDPNSPLANRAVVDGSAKFNKSKPKPAQLKTALAPTKSKSAKPKSVRSSSGGTVKSKTNFNGPMSPPSLPPSRKQSITLSVPTIDANGDELVDLSSKPRCQRCRKSKKGCDRQRPCGRCKDACLPPDQCVSEDEGNGRKGRYGRHMGVLLKKDDALTPTPSQQAEPILLPAPSPVRLMPFEADSRKRKR